MAPKIRGGKGTQGPADIMLRGTARAGPATAHAPLLEPGVEEELGKMMLRLAGGVQAGWVAYEENDPGRDVDSPEEQGEGV